MFMWLCQCQIPNVAVAVVIDANSGQAGAALGSQIEVGRNPRSLFLPGPGQTSPQVVIEAFGCSEEQDRLTTGEPEAVDQR
jgi:hypothetical protein